MLVGETGSAYEEEDDKKWLEDFADFAQARVSSLSRCNAFIVIWERLHRSMWSV